MTNHTECEYFTDFKRKEIPRFAILVFEEKMIPDEEKFKFVKFLLNPYMTDQKFRDEVQGVTLFFLGWKMWGCLGEDRESANIPHDFPGYKIIAFDITDNPESVYLFNIGYQYILMPNGDLKEGIPFYAYADFRLAHMTESVYVLVVGAAEKKNMTDSQERSLSHLEAKSKLKIIAKD